MNLRALIFGLVLSASVTFAQDVQRHSIPAMAGGTPVTATFDGGSCSASSAAIDGGCMIQLRKVTEPDPAGNPRTLNVTSEPTVAACGASVTLYKCSFTCGCAAPAKKAAPPAKKK